MTRIQTTHQLDGLITLDNKKCIAIFSDFDSAILFRTHHPAWEVHIHLVIPRAPQIPSILDNALSSTGSGNESLNQGIKECISVYLTDGETRYKQAVYTAEQLGLAACPPPHPHPCPSPYHVVTEAILNNNSDICSPLPSSARQKGVCVKHSEHGT